MDSARILIVEDNAILAAHLEEKLIQLGYQVIGLTATGVSAIKSAVEQIPDAILMDIRLRGEMTGIQAAEEIRKQVNIPIVYLTAYTDEMLLQQAKLTSAYAYLAKPVRDHELRASLEMALYKHKTELHLEHLNRVLGAVRDVNKLITRERNPQNLMEETCNILVHTRGYKFVWIGQLVDGRLKPIISSGEGRDFVDLIYSTADMDQAQKLPGAESARTAQPVICHNIANDERYAPWREEVLRRNLSSRAAIPMKSGKKFFGVLSVYSERANIFDEDEVDLLMELAGDLAFGLNSIEEELERKQAEEKLRESEKLYRLISENSADVIWIVDPATGRFKYVSPSVYQLRGYTPKEVMSQTLQAALTPESYDFVARKMHDRISSFLEGDKSALIDTFEITQPCKDGSTVPTEAVTTFIIDERGQLVEFLGVSRDISDRKRAEQALQASEARFRGLFENAPVGVLLADAQGNILEVNPAALKILGSPSIDATREINILTFQPLIDAGISADFHECVRSAISISAEHLYTSKWGKSIDLNIQLTPLVEMDEKTKLTQILIEDITERKRSEKKIKHHIEQLTALTEIDRIITSSFNLHLSLTSIVDRIVSQQKVDAADILLMNPELNILEFGAGYGFQTLGIEKGHLSLGEGYAGRAALERQTIHIADLRLQTDNPVIKKAMANDNFVSYYAVPLIAKGKVKGVLEIFHRSPLNPDFEWLDFLNTLAGQAAIAIDNATLFGNLQRTNTELSLAYDATIEGWSRALDLRDKETEGHSLRVTDLVVSLAGRFGFRDSELVQTRWGALLHDIGKMGLPDSILLKPGTLTEQEWEAMKNHPVIAYKLLSPIGFLRSAVDIPYCHHEKWDGTGYPRGLKGEQIPLSARIFAVIDVWDALTSDRVYRKAWSNEKALEYIRTQAGMHFDPHVVDICFESGIFENKGRK